MRTYEQQLNYERLELISRPAPIAEPQPSAMNWLYSIGRKIVDFFSVNSELQIWQTTEPTGETWWRAYDPVSGQSAWLASEDEVLEWVENRYYHNRQ